MDKKNAQAPTDDPQDREEESPKKNDYGFGVKDSPRSLEDIDNYKESLGKTPKEEDEEIDPLDDESIEEEKHSKEVEDFEDDPVDEDPKSNKDVESLDHEESYPPVRQSPDTQPIEEELDREKTLADLAKEDIKDEEDLTPSDQPFKTTNINLDSARTSKPNFQSERQHQNLEQPNFNRPIRGDDLPEEEMEGEIHIPNLRSPRFNSEPNPVRRPLDQNLGDPYPQSPFERNSLRNGPPPKRGASKLHLVILLLLGIAVIGGTVYFLKTQFKGEQAAVVEIPAPTSSPEPTPTPEPEPEANRVDFTVKVLNGTTTTGLASEVTEKLKELGYKTVKGANAPRQDYEQTLVSVKPGQEVLLKTLIKDLSFQFEASAGPELKENDPLDAQIILGKE